MQSNTHLLALFIVPWHHLLTSALCFAIKKIFPWFGEAPTRRISLTVLGHTFGWPSQYHFILLDGVCPCWDSALQVLNLTQLRFFLQQSETVLWSWSLRFVAPPHAGSLAEAAYSCTHNSIWWSTDHIYGTIWLFQSSSTCTNTTWVISIEEIFAARLSI